MLRKTGKQRCENPGILSVDRGNWGWECNPLFYRVLALREECCILWWVTPSGLLVGRGKKVKFRGIFRGKFAEKAADFAGIFEASFAEKRLVKNGRFRESFPGKFCWKATGFALIWGKLSMKLDNTFTILVALSNCMLSASPSKFCLRRFFIFLTSEAHLSLCFSSRKSQCFCSTNS